MSNQPFIIETQLYRSYVYLKLMFSNTIITKYLYKFAMLDISFLHPIHYIIIDQFFLQIK